MRRGQFNKTFPDHFDFGAHRKPYGESSFNRLVRQYKANAKRRGLIFELTDEEMRKLTSACCTYCAAEPSSIMSEKTAHGEYIYNGIDRQNPSVGYLPSNCVTACSTCNRAKSNMSLEDWVAWLTRIRAS